MAAITVFSALPDMGIDTHQMEKQKNDKNINKEINMCITRSSHREPNKILLGHQMSGMTKKFTHSERLEIFPLVDNTYSTFCLGVLVH